MAGTRSSARQAAKGDIKSQPAQDKSSSGTAGTKRKASATSVSQSKKGKQGVEKNQSKIEDTLNLENVNANKVEPDDVDMKDSEDPGKRDTDVSSKGANEISEGNNDEGNSAGKADSKATEEDPKISSVKEISTNDVEMKDQEDSGTTEVKPDSEGEKAIAESNDANANEPTKGDAQVKDDVEKSKPNGFDKLMDQESKDKEEQSKNVIADGVGSKVSATDNAVETSSQREDATPSSILEKGIIYFFFRGRVGVDEPTKVADIARSYIVLRPLPHGAKLGEGPIGDEKKNRLLALPKKVLPKSPKDRFMVFVEKANTSLDEIKQSLSSSDYTTQTVGARHTPAATPIGEGVYAITQTGRNTHLAYILTIPTEVEAVQKDIGLSQRGSYHTSAKNPESKAPANASLPQGANYPKEIIDEFHGRGWMPLEPKLLDYENTQFLIIGHGENALEKAAQPEREDGEKPESETPLEEVEKLEHEDELRVQHLDGKCTCLLQS